jgi:ribosome-associated protein
MSEAILEIIADTIELFKVLKVEGWCSSGAEAKLAIAAGQVKVNNEIETRKRKKIVDGDLINYSGRQILIRKKT